MPECLESVSLPSAVDRKSTNFLPLFNTDVEVQMLVWTFRCATIVWVEKQAGNASNSLSVLLVLFFFLIHIDLCWDIQRTHASMLDQHHDCFYSHKERFLSMEETKDAIFRGQSISWKFKMSKGKATHWSVDVYFKSYFGLKTNMMDDFIFMSRIRSNLHQRQLHNLKAAVVTLGWRESIASHLSWLDATEQLHLVKVNQGKHVLLCSLNSPYFTKYLSSSQHHEFIKHL